MPYFEVINNNNPIIGSITNKKYNCSLIKSNFTYLGLGLFFGFILFLSFNFFNLDLEYLNNFGIWKYFTSNYSSEFINFTDIQSLGFLLYLTYPFITIILGIILWCVLVGILRICLA